eukprot:552620-Prorocentrum_minimum.AAC.5
MICPVCRLRPYRHLRHIRASSARRHQPPPADTHTHTHKTLHRNKQVKKVPGGAPRSGRSPTAAPARAPPGGWAPPACASWRHCPRWRTPPPWRPPQRAPHPPRPAPASTGRP